MIKKRYIIFALFLVVICVMICAGKVYAYSDANNIQCAVLEDAKIDRRLPEMVKSVILGLQIAVPIILVIYGTIDFIKGISSQKEDEIAAGRKTFVKRLIAAILVFFVVAAVKLVISIAAQGNSDSLFACAECFIKGPDSSECMQA